ncbi:hypothetical protein M438DRAFT_272025 [Aureobasidium pullulans EXF-150]|uniref:Uncharacterized protein n=1 Tax=Aureobasidium pullulans EXF-150 TaxID=1043002 RepID=A0A074XNH2_AURPU|nr:uncharacterized protein M438DRAFT_272025 [Aureobasidium pullulans EXF-150]KEQ85229.1 hypothetical protein M438DRAFT_272025 [Aureobasidium pullulans EXF-150]
MLESESRQISIASEAASKKQKQPAKDSLLRNLPISGRHFWKGTLAEQLSATQLDNRPTNKSKRSMPGNELTVMALNEVAISHGRGFFFHVLGRDSWTSWPTEDMHPKSRVPQLPG